MRRWMLAVLAVAVAGCAATKKEPPPKPFTGTKWQMQLELPLAGEQPYVRFGDAPVVVVTGLILLAGARLRPADQQRHPRPAG